MVTKHLICREDDPEGVLPTATWAICNCGEYIGFLRYMGIGHHTNTRHWQAVTPDNRFYLLRNEQEALDKLRGLVVIRRQQDDRGARAAAAAVPHSMLMVDVQNEGRIVSRITGTMDEAT